MSDCTKNCIQQAQQCLNGGSPLTCWVTEQQCMQQCSSAQRAQTPCEQQCQSAYTRCVQANPSQQVSCSLAQILCQQLRCNASLRSANGDK